MHPTLEDHVLDLTGDLWYLTRMHKLYSEKHWYVKCAQIEAEITRRKIGKQYLAKWFPWYVPVEVDQELFKRA